MKVSDFIEFYQNDTSIALLSEYTKSNTKTIQLKGCIGSLDAIFMCSLVLNTQKPQLFLAQNKDEAYAVYSDLNNLKQGDLEILMFPASYKKLYQFEDVDNANIVQRAEVLNKLSSDQNQKFIIITYPEALGEKVINKKSLSSNTFSAKIGEKLDTDFLAELLANYNFEKADFVYEAGQYAVRGGIVDIFSYANEFPYRIELFGDEVESIRTFDPNTQLSIEHKKFVSIVPNVQTKMLQETRESFFNFLPQNTILWIKNLSEASTAIGQIFTKAERDFKNIIGDSG